MFIWEIDPTKVSGIENKKSVTQSAGDLDSVLRETISKALSDRADTKQPNNDINVFLKYIDTNHDGKVGFDEAASWSMGPVEYGAILDLSLAQDGKIDEKELYRFIYNKILNSANPMFADTNADPSALQGLKEYPLRWIKEYYDGSYKPTDEQLDQLLEEWRKLTTARYMAGVKAGFETMIKFDDVNGNGVLDESDFDINHDGSIDAEELKKHFKVIDGTLLSNHFGERAISQYNLQNKYYKDMPTLLEITEKVIGSQISAAKKLLEKVKILATEHIHYALKFYYLYDINGQSVAASIPTETLTPPWEKSDELFQALAKYTGIPSAPNKINAVKLFFDGILKREDSHAGTRTFNDVLAIWTK